MKLQSGGGGFPEGRASAMAEDTTYKAFKDKFERYEKMDSGHAYFEHQERK